MNLLGDIVFYVVPYEAETSIANMVKMWVKTRVEIGLKEWVDRICARVVHGIYMPGLQDKIQLVPIDLWKRPADTRRKSTPKISVGDSKTKILLRFHLLRMLENASLFEIAFNVTMKHLGEAIKHSKLISDVEKDRYQSSLRAAVRSSTKKNRYASFEVVGYLVEELRDESTYKTFCKDLEDANVFSGSLIFVEELAQKIKSAVEKERDRLDALHFGPPKPNDGKVADGTAKTGLPSAVGGPTVHRLAPFRLHQLFGVAQPVTNNPALSINGDFSASPAGDVFLSAGGGALAALLEAWLELCRLAIGENKTHSGKMDQPGSLESRIRSGGSFQPPRILSTTKGRPSKLLQQYAGGSTKKRGQSKGRCSREDSHEDLTDDSKTSRHKWSHAEDVALVNAMVEMAAQWHARPHIESRLKSLKKDWFIVNDMICGIQHGTSGFGFDSTSNMVTAPEDVWEDYLRQTLASKWWRNDVYIGATPTSSRTRTTTADGRGNEAKKKRKVSNDVYIGDQMVAAAQIVANEISKVTSAIRVEHDLRESFINAMAEVHELTDVERAIYGSKIMGRVELMAAFMTLQPESRLLWLHAMFD
ncbi:hypothetical protein Syun_014012 [Stephania yunnanensis]|uniref:Myb/SANT-like domain-containing protein n=1 Tax=Stephania yunnanensis TaxID=152371 RepID=A0AAP0JIP5_9MAGN